MDVGAGAPRTSVREELAENVTARLLQDAEVRRIQKDQIE
jgi:hypothetical protein